MDKTQVDAVAQAILEPNLRAQEEIRRKRAVAALNIARRRQVAWFVLIGGGIGGAAAYFTDVHVTRGIFVGGIGGSFLGWLVISLRAMSRAD
jgi:hypothetical protein